MSAIAQSNLELVVALRRSLVSRDIYDVVVLTDRETEELYQIVLNWGLSLPHYRREAGKAVRILGYEPPEEWPPAPPEVSP